MIVKLTDEIAFPDPREGEPDGWFAVGGDLSVDRLLLAYSYGIFPWYAFRWYDEIHWYCPMQRFVIFPDEIHVSRSMRKLMRKGRYSVSINRDFHNVIRLCGELRHDEEGAWLGSDMIALMRSCTVRALLPALRCGRANAWWAASMVSTLAAAFSARACSRWCPTPAK